MSSYGPPSFASIDLRGPSSSFVNGRPSSYADGRSATSRKPASFQRPIYDQRPRSAGDVDPRRPSSFVGRRPSSNDLQPHTHEEPTPLILEPLFTMKRVDQYPHTPNEELLAHLAKSHYEGGNLDDIILPALRIEMDTESLKIFSEIAYQCLDDKRPRRPNIDQILIKLEKALEIQEKLPMASAEVKETAFNRWKGTPSERLQIPLEDIQKAIENVSQEYLGEGAYGKVYSAELELPIEEKATGEITKKRTKVAIKCITDPQHGKQGFDAEIKLLTGCKHPNVVSLLGFCDDDPNMILVYEIACNGSLDDYLVNADNSTNLTWVKRIQIAIDIACGLDYLHTRVDDTQENIVHRDIKSGNILLGRNLEAKIADFGLSRFHQGNSVKTKNIAGTNFYLCPEYNEKGRLTTAVDIYSFGVVLFEILSGKLANDKIYLEHDKKGIAQIARLRFKDKKLNEMVDTKIMEEVDESTLHEGPNQDSLRTFLDIAYKCIAEVQDDRPTAKHILGELDKALSYQKINKDNLQMSFEEINLATQEFSDKNLIGRGGFGNVYLGKLTRGDKSTTIVAKRFHGKKGQGEEHFLMELEILFDYKHENIIGLEGYCNENGEKIIVYEHAANKSLDRRLSNASLTWTKRLAICIDIAQGLAFLHRDAPTNETVIHRDIKSANILLTDDWKAKISDFGLSAITARNQKVNSLVVGTAGYVDPQAEDAGFFTEKSDIYSLGVLLFEILYGQLVVPTMDYDKEDATRILEQIHVEEKLESIVFKDIKEQISPKSLSTFRAIVSQCLVHEREKRPNAKMVLEDLEKSLAYQEDYEKWGPKLPEDYEEILKLSTYSGTYSTEMKKNLYNLLIKGILLKDDKLLFTLGSNGERTELISARTFSYRNGSPHDNWCINIPMSRFEMVAQMLDISNLMIKIETRAQFLAPDTEYGVYLVFKFCDSRNVSRTPMYVDLKYRKGNETLHAYFSKWRDDEWMMIELYRFLNHKDDGDFGVLLESLSTYYCREHDAIYDEGIEFRPINNADEKEILNRCEIEKIMSRILKHGIGKHELVKENGEADKQKIKELFSPYFKINDNVIHQKELLNFIASVDFGVLCLDDKTILKNIVSDFHQNSNHETMRKDEFVNWFGKWIDKAIKHDPNIKDPKQAITKFDEVDEIEIPNKCEIEKIMSRILKHGIEKCELVNENGEADKQKIEELFSPYFQINDSVIHQDELQNFIASVDFGASWDNEKIFKNIERDYHKNGNHNIMEKDEFVDWFYNWIDKAMKHDPSIKDPKEAIENFDKNSWAKINTPIYMLIPLGSIVYLVSGIAVMLMISGAFMQSIQQFSNAANIPLHLTSFVVIPFVMNARMAVTSFLRVGPRVSKNASLIFSELYNGLVMNNLLGLFTLLAIVYLKGLSWTYSKEVITIMLPCAVVGLFALRRKTYPLWASILAILLYPIYGCLYYVLGS